MGRIAVAPDVLESTGAAIQQVGGQIHQVCGQVDTLRPGVDAAQPETAQALDGFVHGCRQAMGLLGDVVGRFGTATARAGAAYRDTDQTAIPGQGAGTPAPADGGSES